MDPSVLGTGQLVLSRASGPLQRLPVQLPLPPGCAQGACVPPVGGSCVVQGVTVDPLDLFLILNWAPPSGSPADLPLVFTYKSDSANSTELGTRWSGPYHRFAAAEHQDHSAPAHRQHAELPVPLLQQRHVVFRYGPRAEYAGRQQHDRLDRDPARRHELQVRQHGNSSLHRQPRRRALDVDVGRCVRLRAGDPGTFGPPHDLRLQRLELPPAHRRSRAAGLRR